MDGPRLLSASGATASSSCPSSLIHPGPVPVGTASSELGPPFTKRPRVAAELLAPGSYAAGPEADVRALVSVAGGLYPLGRAEALRGLAVVLENADTSGDVARGLVECCHRCAAELMRDDDEDVRLAVVRLVGLCAEKFAARVDVDANGNGDKIDLIFLQLSSMARDMCMKVRVEAFGTLGKMHRVSESVLLQSLSKKVIKTDILSVSIIKGIKLPPKLKVPCAAGIFAHGIEDEFYQVRTAACKSIGALAKFSTQYAQKALDVLMDMMNDDTAAVRLQTLQAVFHMATYGCLNLQEQHMHMFLGLLFDVNALIREAARKILGLVNLSKLQIFKSAVDGLITSLERHPEEQDIYGVLFSIGKNHGSFSANIAKHLAKEISMASDGELILDKPRIKALLIVSISAPFFDDKHKKLDIPSVIFSHAISLVGKVSSVLGEVVNQDMLLSYLCHKGGMPFLENRLVFTESGESEGCSFEAVGEDGGHRESTPKARKCLDVIRVRESTKLILETVEEAWTMRRSCNISSVQTILRTCKKELKLLSENSSGSTGAFLSFLCEYLDAIQFIIEILQLIQLENSYAFCQTSLDILVEKLDISLRRMECCYAGLNRELEVQVLELGLLANLFRLSNIGISAKQILGKLHWLINRLEGLCSDGSYEQSDFSREIKKAFGAKSACDTLVSNICTLLELFHLKPTADYGALKAIRALLQVCDNENPLLYVCGLPVGVSFNISVWNISSHHRLWLRMAVGESIQYTFLELSCFGGDEELRTCSMVVPLYATPMACSFVLRVCLVMEYPYGGISNHQGEHGGPSDYVVQLSDELDVYFVRSGQR